MVELRSVRREFRGSSFERDTVRQTKYFDVANNYLVMKSISSRIRCVVLVFRREPLQLLETVVLASHHPLLRPTKHDVHGEQHWVPRLQQLLFFLVNTLVVRRTKRSALSG